MGIDNIDTVEGLNIRLWLTEDGVHPARQPEYYVLGKLGDPAWSRGEQTRITVPDPNDFQRDKQIGATRGSVERPSFSIIARYVTDLSKLIRLTRKDCRIDVYAFVGKCADPQFFGVGVGAEKILFFPDGDIGNWSGENFGAYGTEESEATGETIELTARELWEFGVMGFSRIATAVDAREIYAVDVCDKAACGDCGVSSDGCQKVISVMAGTGATPGTLPSIIYSEDGGATESTQDIDTMFSNETPTGAACIGQNYVIITDAGEFHYTNVSDLFLGQNTWFQTASGFVVGGEPNALTSVDSSHTWVVGNGGYVYFTSNPPGGVTVQDPGVATSQNLNGVHAFNTEYVLAVGELNTVIFTKNGGQTWESVTGPEVGIAQNVCWMLRTDVWLVGSSQGTLWLTTNSGNTWTAVAGMPVSLTEIDAIEFVDEAEGYLAGRIGASGTILRTITGGNIWTVLPDGTQGTIPANDYLNDLAVCDTGSNTVFGAGLDDDATSGFLVKATAQIN